MKRREKKKRERRGRKVVNPLFAQKEIELGDFF